eukprot:TRINITY_DN77125_c0_g1_i1.p1 TRINITY_DN77125_c0_g1~~TRINITY_DN77125_c0_g1_i1.p1  ORF type:complete len:328 (+),score=25.39 TRINITY_DN77125_c0_g1_i1:67-984(+)
MSDAGNVTTMERRFFTLNFSQLETASEPSSTPRLSFGDTTCDDELTVCAARIPRVHGTSHANAVKAIASSYGVETTPRRQLARGERLCAGGAAEQPFAGSSDIEGDYEAPPRNSPRDGKEAELVNVSFRTKSFRMDTSGDVDLSDESSFENDSVSASWIGDPSWTCFVCSKRLGKLRLRPRHHCRACLRAVCGTCSRSRVQFGECPELRRVCLACTETVAQTPLLQQRLRRLSENLQTILSTQDGHMQDVPPVSHQTQTLEGAVAACEASLVKTNAQLRRERQIKLLREKSIPTSPCSSTGIPYF